MSFPELKLTGDVAKRSISAIELTYQNTPTITKNAQLTRARYDVRRETRTFNVSAGTKQRFSDRPYNAMRFVHTWTGYLDVATYSVVDPGSSGQAQTNIQLMKNAALLINPIPYNYAFPATLGSNEASEIMTYEEVTETGNSWVYEITGTEGTYEKEETAFWIIRDINVVDNNNATSRVTFTFEIVEEWQNIADIVDANTP